MLILLYHIILIIYWPFRIQNNFQLTTKTYGLESHAAVAVNIFMKKQLGGDRPLNRRAQACDRETEKPGGILYKSGRWLSVMHNAILLSFKWFFRFHINIYPETFCLPRDSSLAHKNIGVLHCTLSKVTFMVYI